MALSRRQKAIIISLLVYWPALFVLAHIPIPQLVREAGVSDKSLHFLAYLILVFLLWFAISSDKKVNWRRGTTWWILVVVVLYGVADEFFQPYVGRTRDAMDVAANAAGALAGLLLFSVVSFWPAALLVAGTVIFGITNIARASLADLVPITNAMFHLFAYGVFTALWVRCTRLFSSTRPPDVRWLISAVAVPTLFLLAVKLCSAILGRDFTAMDIVISVGAIAAVVVVAYLTILRAKTQETRDPIKV
jgi:VanZ family protein